MAGLRAGVPRYDQAGRGTALQFHIPSVRWTFKATYTWDNQGGTTSQVLSGATVYRPTPLSCQYGSMGRLSSITQCSCLYYAARQ